MTSAPAGRRARVVVLDHGSGNVRSAVRALERVGADVELTADRAAAEGCDGLVVPGVGAFAAVATGLRAVRGDVIVDRPLAGGRPVLGICVGLQVMFERSAEHGQEHVEGLGQWPGVVERLPAAVVPHMGWNHVEPPPSTVLLKGLEHERFYFVHSFAVQRWAFAEGQGEARREPPAVTWSEHGVRFVAAVENGVLGATQFHPEKSGDAGAHLLENWVTSL
ncbi:MAG: imidazole glycerol phosphate synthase subunit HisH [Kineosporiaceae bacterium]